MADSNPPSHPGLPPSLANQIPSASSTSSSSSSTSMAPIPPITPVKQVNHPPPPSEEVAAIDTRIHLDQKSNKWAYEDDEGNEWEWDQSTNNGNGSWIPVLNEEFIRAQQQAYARQGVDDDEPVDAVKRRLAKKRKASPSDATSSNSKVSKPKVAKPVTSVFVTGLPLDSTVEEIAQVFSRYGVLNEDESGNPRVKLYKDQGTEMFKGEALITYFKPESVDLAVNILDGSCLRANLGQSTPEMKVSKAEFNRKEEGGDGDGDGNEKNKNGNGNGNGKAVQSEASVGNGENKGEQKNENKTRKPLTEQEKKKVQKRMARIQGKLEDWDSDSDPETNPQSSSSSNSIDPKAKTVILSRMFTLAELDEDPELLLDLKEDVREECETFGKVSVVKLWDKEPEGIMTVRFADASAARACVQKMQGRFFASRTIQAVLSSSKPKFRSSENQNQNQDEEGEEEEQRKEAFGDWLEKGRD